MQRSLSRVLGGFGLVTVAALLGGCGINNYLEERGKIDYKSASNAPRTSLEVPPDLVSPRTDERFAVPASRGAERTLSSFERDRAQVAARAGTTSVLPTAPGVRIERSGLQRWLVVDTPPEKLWPTVRDFWTETGFTLETDSAETGILETNWLENRARVPLDFIRRTFGKVVDGVYSSGTLDKFRTRVERLPDGRSEIYVSHRGMEEVTTTVARDSFFWQRRAPEPDLEAEMLNRLMLKLSGGQRAEQLVASSKPAAQEVRDVRISGEGAGRGIDLDDPFDRAWRRVGLALDRGGFTVEDRDRSRGAYFVRYIDADEQARAAADRPGFFSRLFSRSTKPELSQQYRLNLVSAGTGVRLTIQDKDGKPTPEADRATVNRILDLLMQQMLL
ncbi:MAG: outer membrane protein assembly factor BamC [Betaproteobacteria bacterium]|nr:outer membrane protein assembly factor BamC [Betaproteobacteria bacterium]